ncbi:MAG: hypothetical protein QHH07_09110 [Sedimentisphaerales bacterium]|nr:hypothetical protein [Sedimentisphaerales bacterium]
MKVKVFLLAIQPAYLGLGEPISPQAQEAIASVSRTLIQIFGPPRSINTPGPVRDPGAVEKGKRVV